MKRLLRPLLTIIVISLAGYSSAGPIRFEHLTVNDGLPENSIRAIIQDQEGFLWFGTQNGVARYDGAGMEVHLPNPDDPGSIDIRFVLSMAEDDTGSIWMGSFSAGISLYDPVLERFTNFPSGEGYPGPGITTIRPAADGVWITTATNALFRAVGHQLEQITVVPLQPVLGLGLTGLDVTPREVWVGSTQNGLAHLDRSTSTWRIMRNDPDDPESLPSDFITFVHRDRQGRVWVGSRAGLALHKGDGRFTIFKPRPDLGAVEANYLVCITEDPSGRLWIGAASGLYLFDPDTGTFVHHVHDPDKPDSPVLGPVLSIHCDRSGIIWAGSWHTGLNKYDPGSSKFEVLLHDPSDPHSLDESAIGSVFEDSRGTLWVGTGPRTPTGRGGALNRRRPGQYGFDRIHFPGNNEARVRTVYRIIEDRQGDLLLGTNLGLWQYEEGRGTIIRPDFLATAPAAVINGRILDMGIDGAGRIWVTVWLVGVHRYDPLTSVWKSFRADPADPASLMDDGLSTVCLDESGQFWLGSDKAGLQVFDPATDSFLTVPGLEGEMASVGAIVPAGEGRVLVSTGAGILLCEPSGIVQTFTTRTGLPSDYAGQIILDLNKDLWVSTGLGLARTDLEGGPVTVFDERDGLPRNELYFASHISGSGQIFFGGHSGLVSFHPDSLQRKEFVPPVHITGISLHDERLAVGPDSPLQRSLRVTETLNLDPLQNDISLTFASLDYAHPERNRYRYRLEPHDGDWREATELNAAHYTNLDPGTYRFSVMGSNSDGLWNETPTTLRIVIAPPWYKTKWANAVFGLALLLLVIGIYRQLLNRERMRMDLVIERAEASHLHELDQLKSRFFANISHEFRTPLTLLSSPLRKLQEDPSTGTPELFGTMARNARRLGRLIDQLLDLSRLEADSMPTHWRHGDWVQFLKAMATSFGTLADQQNILLESNWPEENPPAWYIPDLLDKVVVNLLSNALKFTPSGGEVILAVSVAGKPRPHPWPGSTGEQGEMPDADMITVMVRNTGSHIPPDDLEFVFDRFHQVVEQSDFSDLGSGIGLALVKELTEWCGGQVGVTSDLQTGTTFTVTLPVYLSAPQGALAPEAAEAITPSTDPSRELEAPETDGDEIEEGIESTLPSILIVEDNADLRHYVRDELSDEFQVLVAANGKSGLELARREIPDLVLSDVMMPVMDGLELCRQLKADDLTNHIPVILLTAKAEASSRKEGLQTGADDYVAKPFDVEELRIRIQNLIEQRRLLAERYNQLEVARPGRAPNPVPSADDRFLARARDIIADHYEDPDFRVDGLCREIGMSRTQLHRKLKAVSGRSAGDFLRTERLNKAAEMLATGEKNVTEVAYSVGYRSLSQFAKAFREQFGMAPSDFEA